MLFDKILKRKKKDGDLLNEGLPPVGAPSADGVTSADGDPSAAGAPSADSAPSAEGAPMVGEEEAGWEDYGDEDGEKDGSSSNAEPSDGGLAGAGSAEEAAAEGASVEGASVDTPPIDIMPSGEDEPEPPQAEKSEIDKQLEQMLEADRLADEKFNPQQNKGLVKKTSVFDGSIVEDDNSHPELQWETYEKKKERAAPIKSVSEEKPKGLRRRLMSLSVPKLLILSLAVVAVFLGIGFGVILIAQNIIKSEAEKEDISHYLPVTQPLNVTNDGNFIFINQTLDFNGTRFTLSKISAGILNTMVYFVQPPDLERYSFYITDQNQNLYMRREYGHSSSAMLEFDPLRINTVFLTITIHDNDTYDEASFFLRFTELPSFGPANYFNSVTPVMPEESADADDGDMVSPVNIERVVVGNTGTEVYYTIGDDDGGGIRFGDDADGQFIQLKQGNHYVRSLYSLPAEARFDSYGKTVGKMVFDPLPYTNREIDLIFNDLYYTYSIRRRSADTSALLDYENNEPQTILTGTQKLVLEALGIQGTHIILVLHGEDEDGQRIETKVKAQLQIDSGSGSYSIDGECFSGEEGSDVVFSLSEDVYGAVRGTPIENYSIALDTVEYNIPQLEVPIDLTQTEPSSESWLSSAMSFLNESFENRLAYKAHLIGIGDVTGFSAELMSDRALMRYYQPSGMSEMPKYSTSVVSGVLLPDNVFTGVVEEEWAVGSGEDLVRRHLTHRVVCERQNSRWTVTEDEIIDANNDN